MSCCLWGDGGVSGPQKPCGPSLGPGSPHPNSGSRWCFFPCGARLCRAGGGEGNDSGWQHKQLLISHVQGRIPTRSLCVTLQFGAPGNSTPSSSEAGYPGNLLPVPHLGPQPPVWSPCSRTPPLPNLYQLPGCCARGFDLIMPPPAPRHPMAPYYQEIRSKPLSGIPRPHLPLLSSVNPTLWPPCSEPLPCSHTFHHASPIS